MKEAIIETIKRYECWLSLPFVGNNYWKTELSWREEVKLKIEELKQKIK